LQCRDLIGWNATQVFTGAVRDEFSREVRVRFVYEVVYDDLGFVDDDFDLRRSGDYC
jgi:regulation of enolase protein 1 (concanavalin A-like superfamily)